MNLDDNLTPFVRLDYSDEAGWNAVRAACMTETSDGFMAELQVLDDPSLDGAAIDKIATRFLGEFGLLVFADKHSMSGEHTVVCVDGDDHTRSFRCIPSELWGPENNLRLYNMEFDEFESAVGPDGVFRGF